MFLFMRSSRDYISIKILNSVLENHSSLPFRSTFALQMLRRTPQVGSQPQANSVL